MECRVCTLQHGPDAATLHQESATWHTIYTLRSNPFLPKLTMNTMNFLMKCGEMQRIIAGEVISQEGEPSEHVYIIIDGEAEITKIDEMGNKTKIAVVKAGGLIGEMGVFLDMKRSATVIAATDMTLVKFTNESFINALPKTPDLTVRLLKSLTDKVNVINQSYADISGKNVMLIVGMYIMEIPHARGTESLALTLNIRRIAEETRLGSRKIATALNRFQKAGLITDLQIGADKSINCTAQMIKMRDFFRTLGESDPSGGKG